MSMSLSIRQLPPEPFALFEKWFEAARRRKDIADATAMCLSTVNADEWPDGRLVLLKSFDERGFVFFTNMNSVKGKALKKSSKAALTFDWPALQRQVRLQGRTEIVSDEEADAYWRTRDRLAQLGAWASQQSEALSSRAILVKEVAKLAVKYKWGPVPRPPFWTGVRVVPRRIEFWQGRPYRLHDRFLYMRKDDRWQLVRLYP
jgi:pyridoxamine 5'-phosphate oxidase